MEIETVTSRETPAVGAALPGPGAAHRGALTRYAAMLLEGSAGEADEIVEVALKHVAESLAAAGAETAGSSGALDAAPGDDDERTVEKCFAAVRRQALMRQRRDGLRQRTAVADGDEPTASLGQRIERLTPKQREAVTLTFSHGFGYEAVAGITGLSVKNVGFLLHSALTHLREASARGATVAAADDARVTDYVLGEMSAAEASGLEGALRHDPDVKTAVSEVRALAGELRGLLARGDEARQRAKKRSRRTVAGLWREKWVWAWVVGVVAIGVGAVWFSRQRSVPTVAISSAGDGEAFRLKPDAWKLANARVESGESDQRGSVGAMNPGRDRSRPGPAAPAEKAVNVKPADDLAPGTLAGPGGSGAGGASVAEQGLAAPEGGAGAKESPAEPLSAAGAGKAGSETGGTAGSASKATDGAAEKSASSATIKARGAAPGGGPQPPSALAPASSGAATARAPKRAAAGVGRDAAGESGAAASAADAAESTRASESRVATARELRRVIAGKRWPSRAAVSVEALLGDFPAEVAVPTGAPEIAVSVEIAEAPWATERRLVCVRLTAAPAQSPRSAAARVILLIDVSASMDAPNRLPLVQDAARRLLQSLRPEDRVAVVTYAGEARVALPPTLVAQAGAVRAALGALRAEGMTNGGAGLQRAYELARVGFIAGGVNRVLWCTDGDFNMGMTSETELAALVEAEAQRGVELGVFGFGRGRGIDPRLEALAVKGRGGSGNVNTLHEAERLMAAEVNGWQAAVARDMSVEFACDPTRIVAGRWVGLGESFLPPETSGRRSVRVAELSPGETVTALFEVIPTPRGGEVVGVGGESGVTMRVGYTAIGGSGERVQRTLVVPVPDAGTRWPEASGAFKFSATVAGLGLALGEAPVASEKLEAVVRWAESVARDRTARDAGGYREEFLALAREARDLARSENRR